MIENRPNTPLDPPKADPIGMSASGMSMIGVYAAATSAILIWSTTAIVTKEIVDTLDPFAIALLRSVFAGLISLPFALSGLRMPRPRGRREIIWLVVSGLTGFAFFPIFYVFAIRYTTVSHLALILTSQSIFTGLMVAAGERHWPGSRWIIGCLIALAGEVFLIGFRFGFSAGGSLLGDFLALMAALVASWGYVTGTQLSHSIGTWAATLWGNVLAGIVTLPFAIYVGAHVEWTQLGGTVWASLAFLALGPQVLAYIAFYWALTKGGITRVSLILFANPITTVLLAVAILGEPITVPLAMSGAVILLGVWLAQRRGKGQPAG